MSDKKEKLYFIQLFALNGEIGPAARVRADEIQHGDYPGSNDSSAITLLLEGNTVGKFCVRNVVGWWTTDLDGY